MLIMWLCPPEKLRFVWGVNGLQMASDSRERGSGQSYQWQLWYSQATPDNGCLRGGTRGSAGHGWRQGIDRPDRSVWARHEPRFNRNSPGLLVTGTTFQGAVGSLMPLVGCVSTAVYRHMKVRQIKVPYFRHRTNKTEKINKREILRETSCKQNQVNFRLRPNMQHFPPRFTAVKINPRPHDGVSSPNVLCE